MQLFIRLERSLPSATNLNNPNTIVERDVAGNFVAGAITANVIGNATTATSATTAGSATNFTGNLGGDVTGTQGAAVVSLVGGQTAGNVAAASILANNATPNDTPNQLVLRNSSGNFAAGTITGNLIGTEDKCYNCKFCNKFYLCKLAGDVIGLQSTTVVSTVGGQSAANIASGIVASNAATALNTASMIVKRDASGNFSAGTITANLSGNATNATTATNFSGSLVGDVTGSLGATVVSMVGGQPATNVASGAVLANAATASNTANTITLRDSSEILQRLLLQQILLSCIAQCAKNGYMIIRGILDCQPELR